MRRLVRSEGYARVRLVTGTLFAVFGAVVVLRTAAGVGLAWQAVPAYVMGLALLVLGLWRFREYYAVRRK